MSTPATPTEPRTGTMRPSEVLDAQRELRDRVLASEEFRGWVRSCVNLGYGDGNMAAEAEALRSDKSLARARRLAGFPGEDTMGDNLVAALPDVLQLASTYHVTGEMTDLVLAAAAGLDDTDRVNRHLPPSTWGFVRFDKPLPMRDVRSHMMLIHYLAWFPTSSGVAVLSFNDLDTEPDESFRKWMEYVAAQPDRPERRAQFPERLRPWMGRWAFVGLDAMEDGAEVGPPLVISTPEALARLAPNMLYKAGGPADIEPVPWTNVQRYAHALWLLLGQTVVETARHPVDRHAARRAERAGLVPAVTVIRLRRSKHPRLDDDGPNPVEWSCQWITKSHWRWQPHGRRHDLDHDHVYPPPEDAIVDSDGHTLFRPCLVIGCDAVLIRTFIHEFVKGPHGLPLKVSAKVYDLRR